MAFPQESPLLRGPRAAVLAGLVVLTVSLAGILAFEAYQATQSHRLTAERLLRDYASFAAFELLANGEKTVETNFVPVLAPLTRTAETPFDPLLSPAVLATAADSVLRCPTRTQDSVRNYFRIDFGDGRVTWARTPLFAAARWVRDTVLVHYRGLYQPASGYAVILNPRSELAVVYAVKYAPHRAPLAAYGVVTCSAALGPALFRQALARGPLLPAAVTGPVPGDSLVAIQVRTPAGETVYTVGPPFQSRFQAEASSTRLGGMTVHAALAPGAVERLAVAQAPSPPLPLLMGLFALTVALALVAVIQLRREHELARLRSDFVSSVSHELRTPLAQILLYGETLALGRTRSEDARRDAAETIVGEARRLIRMVENILQLSRTSRASSAAGDVRPTDLSALARSVVSGFEPLARRAGVKLELKVDPPVHALADDQSTRQILLNLLDNALKHGPRDQTVTVGTSKGDGTARLWVEDRGKGVAPAEREKVFERFARGSGSSGAGAGIGLAVVKELVELQGGRVWVEDGIGGGARFVVEMRNAEVGMRNEGPKPSSRAGSETA